MAQVTNLLVVITLLSHLILFALSCPPVRSDLLATNDWDYDLEATREVLDYRFKTQTSLPLSFIITNNGSHTFSYDRRGNPTWINKEASSVLNNAISSTLGQGGGRIFVSAAVYEIHETVRIWGSNLELSAEKGAIFKTASDLGITLQISNETGETVMNIRVSGLTFDGNNYRVTDPFHGIIWVYNAQNIVFDDVEVTRSGVRENYMGHMLIPQAGLHACNIQGLWIRGCFVHDNSGSGAIISSRDGMVSRGVYISHNRLMRNNMSNATGGYAAIDLRGCHFIIAFNTIYRAPFGVHLAGNYTANGNIFRNIFIGNAGEERIAESGIEVWSEGVSNISIKHNYFAKWCYEKGGGGAGIELGNFYSQYIRDGVHHCEVAHNIIDCGGYPPSLVTFGITINGKYNNIYSNTICKPNPEGIVETGVSELNKIYKNRIVYTSRSLLTDASCVLPFFTGEDAFP